MRKLLAILLSIFCTSLLTAQNTDSLKQVLATANNDNTRVSALSRLSWIYLWQSPDTALLYAQQELLLAKNNKREKWEADALNTYGVYFNIVGNYPLALDYTIQAFNLAEKTQDTSGILDNLFSMVSIYRDIADYRHALYYGFDAKKVAESANKKNKVVVSLAIISSVYEKQNQLDTALSYSQHAYHLDSIVNGTSTLKFIPDIIGNVYYKKQNYPLALVYYRKCIQTYVARNNLKDIIDGYNGIARTFIKLHDVDSAKYYCRLVFSTGRLISYPLGSLEACKTLADLYNLQHNPDSTLMYNQLAAAIQDSIFNKETITQFQTISFSEKIRRQDIAVAEMEYKNKVRTYLLAGGLVILLLFAVVLYRSNQLKQKANKEIKEALEELKTTQVQLIQSEKMASLGELTAGIAHEIQNPLNFVNNFSEVNRELIEELEQEAGKGNIDEVKSIANDIKENEQKIAHHGKRADAIVKGMLQHSRTNTGQKEPTDINALADEYLRLSYQGFRTKDKSFNATIETHFDESIGKIEVVPQDIGRVLLNLFNNAFYAVNERKKQQPEGYEPTVTVITKEADDKIEIIVKDNGTGISQKAIDKVFQPFFTTKPTGQGTGLGLSLSYDIIKAHGGSIEVESDEGEGAEFIIIFFR